MIEPYVIDYTPLFVEKNDPFVLRFKVKPIVWVPLLNAIPITENHIWDNLSFTQKLDKADSKSGRSWNYMVFSSPYLRPETDCTHLESSLLEQSKNLVEYPFTEKDKKNLKVHKIKIDDHKSIIVSIPEDDEE